MGRGAVRVDDLAAVEEGSVAGLDDHDVGGSLVDLGDAALFMDGDGESVVSEVVLVGDAEGRDAVGPDGDGVVVDGRCLRGAFGRRGVVLARVVDAGGDEAPGEQERREGEEPDEEVAEGGVHGGALGRAQFGRVGRCYQVRGQGGLLAIR